MTYSLTTVWGVAETPEMYRQRAGRCPGEYYHWPARSGAILGAWGDASADRPPVMLALGVLVGEHIPVFAGLPHYVPTPTTEQIRAWVAWANANRIDPHRARTWVLPDGEPAFLLDGRKRSG